MNKITFPLKHRLQGKDARLLESELRQHSYTIPNKET